MAAQVTRKRNSIRNRPIASNLYRGDLWKLTSIRVTMPTSGGSIKAEDAGTERTAETEGQSSWHCQFEKKRGLNRGRRWVFPRHNTIRTRIARRSSTKKAA